MSGHESYNTLSYRWSQVKQVLLTVESKQELQGSCAINKLSKVFQDTILVSRYLGVRYLWIDCLCIIQAGDEGKDWNFEASRIAEIYQSAYLNVSADEASGSNGLFFKRCSDTYAQVKVHLQIKALPNISEWMSIDKGMWIAEVNRSPLSERGWVFQERVLSPRVVHFSRQGIFWGCREKSLCESFPSKLPSPELFDLGDSVSLRRLELWDGSSWHSDQYFPVDSTLYEILDDIVKAYSKCQFSYASDKLVALAGIAKHMKSIIKDTYVAGMWCKYLAAELAWWIEPNRERFVHGREPPYYTPSYSWASAKGKINSAGPFALGILVDVAFVPLNLKPLSQNVWNEDFFGFSRQPFFRLQVMGKLRAGRIRKIDDDWRIVPNMVCDAEYKKADNAKFSSFVVLDVDIEDAARKAFEGELFYFMLWRSGPNAGDYTME